MNLHNEVRIRLGERPHYPEGATFQVEDVEGASLLHAGGVPSYVVRAYPPGSDPNVPGEQCSPTFETKEAADRWCAWLRGEVEHFTYPDGAA